MDLLKKLTFYDKTKAGFYITALLLTVIFFDFEEVGMATHTPPLSFIIPFLFCLVGILWLIIDLLILSAEKINNKNSGSSEYNISTHLYGLIIPGIFVIGIILYSL